MKIIVLFLLLGAFLSEDVYCQETKEILMARRVTIEDFPYQVLLIVLRDGVFFQCSGSIISNKSILTAAHCLDGASKMYVRTGITSTGENGETIVATKFTLHPEYNKKTHQYDIGIVTLDNPLQLDGIQKKIVRLAAEGTYVRSGERVTVTGWGFMLDEGKLSDHLLADEVAAISDNECRNSYIDLTTEMFCAGIPKAGIDTCQGDTGGPAVLGSDKIQVGVVSYGIGCANKRCPGIFTSVSSTRAWIREVSGV